MIKSIKIEKLFDIFDYDISFQNEENILIITGPNGFGKTKILNIIYSLFNREYGFFDTLVFKKITMVFSERISIEISKFIFNNKFQVHFALSENEERIDFFKSKNGKRRVKAALDEEFSLDPELQTILAELNKVTEKSAADIRKNSIDVETPQRKKILDSITVHLIKEQRLIRINTEIKKFSFGSEQKTSVVVETIQVYAEELKQIIAKISDSSGKITRELDSTYPKRLMSETDNISVDQFKNRFNILKEKQHKLKVFGISESEQEVPEYSEKNATALLVYLKDSEKKISVFDEIVGKLELFTSILNERRLTFKSIKIDKEKGFIFVTDKGKELKLTDLSSGEQHEVVLLYELIFNTKENTVLLIDEPEISLHITWQKEFVKDLIKIIKLQKIQVIIATHAPSIVNDRWDLVYSLPKPESV